MLKKRAKPSLAQKPAVQVEQAIASVSRKDLESWVRQLSVPRHFTMEPGANERTAFWIAEQLGQWGYSVQMQGRWRNVVAMPKRAAGRRVLVGAHYDSVAGCPGADDNASAVAAMLGCAKACAEHGYSVAAFVAFNCEEDGLLGSRDFVQWLGSPAAACAGVHILEMVGFASDAPGSQMIPKGLPVRISDSGNFLGLLANRSSHQMLKPILSCASTYLPELPVLGLRVTLGLEKYFPVLLRSDHAPFWEQGIPAVMWTDTSEFRNPHYHQPSDKPSTLNYQFLHNVTKLLVASVLEPKMGVNSK
jgi:Zn-dependent M28 family amino/carboxypeptidase